LPTAGDLLKFTAEDEVFLAATDAFSKATGVKISIIRESNDDVQPKASVELI
jgi:multiple sugar transport system substrate-binding protein